MGTQTNDAASSGSEGAPIASIPAHQPVSRVVTFQDQNALRNDNPQPNECQMPESVDLHSSGLRRLSRLVALHSSETIEAHSTSSKKIKPHSKLPIKRGFLKAACLALFSSICAYGTATALVHSHQSIAKSKPSLLASAVNSSLSQYSL
jgi:hypothetical protein